MAVYMGENVANAIELQNIRELQEDQPSLDDDLEHLDLVDIEGQLDQHHQAITSIMGEDQPSSDDDSEHHTEVDIDSEVDSKVDIEVVIDQLDQHHQTTTSQQQAIRPGIFQRLTTGDMFLSQRLKSAGFLKRLLNKNGYNQYIPKRQALKGILNKILITDLTKTSLKFEDLCELILKSLDEVNNETLVQKKWLTETKHLLINKILTIGVFGRHNAGKSTVLNALLHQDILPTAVTNETAAMTEIRHDKLKHVSGDKDCLKTNCSNCPTWGCISGRRKIRHRLEDIHISIRKDGKKILNNDALTACVPFMSPYSTGDIQVVLMDTPGLSEANELGIADISEHQLMTCSAYIYVISCTQLEDEIDTETLRAIVERDPGVFTENRMLIVVTRLDDYKEARKKTNDSRDIKRSSDDEDEPDFEGLIESVKQRVQDQLKSICAVPDKCIIPVSAKGALEARKELYGLNSDDADEMLAKFKKRVGKRITIEELEAYSQVSVLEKRIGHILENVYSVWKHAIIRDCSRYLCKAMSELDGLKEAHRISATDFTEKWMNKDKLLKDFNKKCKTFKSNYQHGSRFHRSLESAYETDIESHHSHIVKKCEDEFESFRLVITEKKKLLTAKEYHDKCENFLDYEKINESLMSHFEHLKFQNVNEVINEASYDHGKVCAELESLFMKYYEMEPLDTDNSEKSVRRKSDAAVMSSLRNVPVKNAPLELKDLLAHGKSIDYTILEKMKILAQRVSLRITVDDPKRLLLGKERDALLDELLNALVEDCKNYFINIKGKIVHDYIEEHVTLIKDHEKMLKKKYQCEKDKMDKEQRFFRTSAGTHKTMVEVIGEQIEFLKQLQVRLIV